MKSLTAHEILQERGAIGEENAMPTETLTELTGLSRRAIVKMVNSERRKGIFIISTCGGKGGYYLSATNEEKRVFLEKQTAACRRTLAVLHNLKKAAETERNGAGLFDERLDNGQK